MVVEFTPSESSSRSRARTSARTSGTDGTDRTSGTDDGHIAPVTYLPGAQPSAAAADAREKVRTTARHELGNPRGRQRAQTDADQGDARGGAGARQGARASNVSMHQLARRGMSRWELEQVLVKRGVDDATAGAELDRLESVGLLDDAALALTLVYTQHTRKGLGRAAIAQELRRRHIDPEIIDEALAEIDDDDEHSRALELALKRVGQLRNVDDETATRRLSGFLARKGYSSETVREAVRTAMHGRSSGVRFQ